MDKLREKIITVADFSILTYLSVAKPYVPWCAIGQKYMQKKLKKEAYF